MGQGDPLARVLRTCLPMGVTKLSAPGASPGPGPPPTQQGGGQYSENCLGELPQGCSWPRDPLGGELEAASSPLTVKEQQPESPDRTQQKSQFPDDERDDPSARKAEFDWDSAIGHTLKKEGSDEKVAPSRGAGCDGDSAFGGIIKKESPPGGPLAARVARCP